MKNQQSNDSEIPVYLTAIVTALPGNIDTVKSALLNLVANAIQEESCLQYDLHQSSEDPHIFIFQEKWKDQQSLDRHNKMPYLLEFGKIAQDIVQLPLVIYKTNIIS